LISVEANEAPVEKKPALAAVSSSLEVHLSGTPMEKKLADVEEQMLEDLHKSDAEEESKVQVNFWLNFHTITFVFRRKPRTRS
jgi:hypothetical protein